VALVEQHSVEVAQLFLLELLPFAHGMFSPHMVRFDNDQWRGGPKPDPSLDPYDGLADMDVPSDGVLGSDVRKFFDVGHWSVLFPINGHQFPFAECQLQFFWKFFFQLTWIGIFR